MGTIGAMYSKYLPPPPQPFTLRDSLDQVHNCSCKRKY